MLTCIVFQDSKYNKHSILRNPEDEESFIVRNESEISALKPVIMTLPQCVDFFVSETLLQEPIFKKQDISESMKNAFKKSLETSYRTALSMLVV